MANLQEQFPVGRKLQRLTVPAESRYAIRQRNRQTKFSSHPNVPFFIHVEADFVTWPVGYISPASPTLDKVAIRVEFKHRGRRAAAFVERWRLRCGCCIAKDKSW